MKTLLNYLFRGLLFIFPVFATLWIIAFLVNWANDLFNRMLFDWLEWNIPGLGLVTAILFLILLGFLVTRAFTRPLFRFFEQLMEQTPFIKIIYTALKDLTEAFVGDKKRFNKPVVVSLSERVDRIGFVTSEDLSTLNLEERVAVYCPHSYNFSGNLFLVDAQYVRPLEINPSDAMKYAVSAGVTHLPIDDLKSEDKSD